MVGECSAWLRRSVFVVRHADKRVLAAVVLVLAGGGRIESAAELLAELLAETAQLLAKLVHRALELLAVEAAAELEAGGLAALFAAAGLEGEAVGCGGRAAVYLLAAQRAARRDVSAHVAAGDAAGGRDASRHIVAVDASTGGYVAFDRVTGDTAAGFDVAGNIVAVDAAARRNAAADTVAVDAAACLNIAGDIAAGDGKDGINVQRGAFIFKGDPAGLGAVRDALRADEPMSGKEHGVDRMGIVVPRKVERSAGGGFGGVLLRFLVLLLCDAQQFVHTDVEHLGQLRQQRDVRIALAPFTYLKILVSQSIFPINL